MKLGDSLKVASLSLFLSFAVLPAQAQETSSKTEIKKSGSETKAAGKSLGSNMKRGRVVRGGKHFGKHMGKAGKHLGKSTAKAFKKIF